MTAPRSQRRRTDTDHHSPLGRRGYLSQQHIERYRFAVSRLQAVRRVLDIACGTGYGTAMLRAGGCEAVGGELSEALVARATAIWGEGLFVRADALDLPFETEAFDAVVTFETIEHVSDAATFLAEMRRVLRPGGTLICSTPHIRYTAHPPYHVKEYTPQEFFDTIAGTFGPPERLGQYFRWTDRLGDLCRRPVRRTLSRVLGGLRRSIQPTDNAAVSQPTREHHRRVVEELDLTCGSDDAYYAVRPYDGPNRLRIMVAVATRGAAT